MKTTLYGLLATTLLMFAALAAQPVQADDRGFRDRGAGGWRLGERTRDGYAIYRGGYRVPGSAIALADGWALGSRRESGGYAIYRWNGHDWDQAPGGAVEIGGSYRRPWVINNRGQRFTWNGRDWNRDFTGVGRGFRNNNRGVGREFNRGFRQDQRNPFRGRGFNNRQRDRNIWDRNRGNRGWGFDRRQRGDYRGRFDRRQRGDYRGRNFWNW